jgi:signal transduction histidine kinase
VTIIRNNWRVWFPAGTAASVVLVAGIVEVLFRIHYDSLPDRGSVVPIIIGTAAAVGLAQRWPLVALALAWMVCGYQAAMGVHALLVEMALAAVAFGTSRWGRAVAVVAGIISVPVAVVPASLSVGRFAAILVVVLFAVSWLAGLALRRLSGRAAESMAAQRAAEEAAARAHRESEQAREIAQLREGQAQLARDVHDVVGHSLAVILAQAQAAEFIDDADTVAVRTSMANIAQLARSSLQDIRQVLGSTKPFETVPGELRNLVEGVRAICHTITFDELGTARTLPPELATVAYRVLQEMLTNAIRHGSRDTPVTVQLHWASELRIQTVNHVVHSEPAETGQGGHGLVGMRRRLAAVGGRLDVLHSGAEDVNAGTFTATAWVPLRNLYS